MLAFSAGASIATSAGALPKLQLFSNLSSPFPTSKQRLFNAPFLFQPSNLTRTYPSSTVRVAAASVGASDMASPSPSTTPASGSNRFAVLFVCLGNICRSPAAEGVFRTIVKQRGFLSNFTIDSAGTINYHEGNEADPRMKAASERRGIEITSISRPIRPSDFKDFDLILAMDMQNKDDILKAFNSWKIKESLPGDAYEKVKVMCSYCKKHKETEVPDPYYGGPQGFEKVLDLLEDACGSLLDSIIAENKHASAS